MEIVTNNIFLLNKSDLEIKNMKNKNLLTGSSLIKKSIFAAG